MSVRVVARIRPLLGKELDKDTIVRAESSEEGKPTNIVRIPNPKNEVEEFSFTFNSVYDTETPQEELFNQEVAPTLKSLFQGLDVTLFAYGVTGTGKTHTMRGGLKLSERGVIPRLLSGIFRRGRKVAKDTDGETTVSVMLSYYEIYCDKVFDLFQPLEKRTATPAGLPLREKDGRTIVVGLSERECGDLKEFEKLYIEANNNRVTAATKLNAQSSRSHAILMVKVIQTTGDEVRTSTASAIDLAGSEDNRRTDNGKERLVESASINKSLFVLSQCIDAIGRGDKRIPYRESKMTRILSLGQNNGITVMILNLAPLRSYHLDTLSSLNVSSRAKRIEVREIENEVVFKQPPRTMSSISGSNIQRQPLRPLANAHNVNIAIPAGEKKGDKPLKAFSVYSDKTRNARANNTAPLKDAKRPLDTQMNTRPTKMVRPNTSVSRTAAEMSAAKIEEMVERKVSEILAKKAKNEPAPVISTDTLSEAVQRRLEALEKKIEDGEQEETRAEGLRFLLMAKQHKERGEDSSALKMYELALPYFPGQDKLIKKMDNLRAKIRAKKEASTSSAASVRPQSLATAPIAQQPTPASSFQEDAPRRRHKASDDDDFAPPETHDEIGDYEDDSFIAKPKAKKRTKALKVFTDTASISHDGPPSPRTAHLLDIVNSRDVAMIKGLVGIGAKKAKDLVEFLEFQDDEDGGRIESLRQLENVPGMGRRGVERAYEGLALLA